MEPFIFEENPQVDGRGRQQRDAFFTKFARDFDKAVDLNADTKARRMTRALEERTLLAEKNHLIEWTRANNCKERLYRINDVLKSEHDDALDQILAILDAPDPEPEKKSKA
jgi:hypothetical protein